MAERVAVALSNISDLTVGVGDGGKEVGADGKAVGDGGKTVGDGGKEVGVAWQPATTSPASPISSHSIGF